MFIRFKKKTTLPVCAYDDAYRRCGAGVDEEFNAGDETEVSLLRENEGTLDIEIPGSGIVFELPKADVEVMPLDAVEGSHILQGILPWPWEAEPTTEVKTGEVRWEVLQSQNLHNGTHFGLGEWDILLSSDTRLTEAEARLIAKAPDTVLLLRPDHVADGFGPDTYLAQVKARSANGAVVAARKEVTEMDDLALSPTDYHPLITIEGWHDDIKPERYLE